MISTFHLCAVIALALSLFPTSTICGLQTIIKNQNLNSDLRKGDKVPGTSPASYCSSPSTDIFKISSLSFDPNTPRLGNYLTVRFLGFFIQSTGETPWLNVTGTVGGGEGEVINILDMPLCDIDVFQFTMDWGKEKGLGLHRSCPTEVVEGDVVISTPPILLHPRNGFRPGKNYVKAEATTMDGRSIFCVEGSLYLEDFR